MNFNLNRQQNPNAVQAKRDHRSISRKLGELALPQPTKKNLETVESFSTCSRERPKDKQKSYNRNLGLTALENGVAVIYTTDNGLAHRSHRFIFPDDGEPSYHAESFNVDCQAMPGPSVNLQGIEEIAKDETASRELSLVRNRLSVVTEHDVMEMKPIPAATC